MSWEWETVIGLEVHAELSTESKMFCSCTVAFGGAPNTHVCPVCLGMPGTLPVMNRNVVDYALRLGIALGCEINRNCKFDRKNYFYPDLPKAYQVSQLYIPICRDGNLEIESDGKKKDIRVREIHMEEDAGKLIHDNASHSTIMDFNRCGVPLLEIVTEPDFRSSSEVLAYLEKLREILLYLDICDCKMQEGSMRVDINLSVRRIDGELGVRTEMKNLNSFKAIGRAIECEAARQVKILDKGGYIEQETRRWDDDAGESYAMRSKENTQDYRYFPEPDLLPIYIDDEWLRVAKQSIPEMAHEKRERYTRNYGLSEYEAAVITGNTNISELYEDVLKQSGEPLESARLITGEIMRLLNQTNTPPEELSVDSHKLSALVTYVTAGKINRNAYKEAIEAVFTRSVDPQLYIEQNGLMMQSDSSVIDEIVRKIITEYPEAVAEYLGGKEKTFGFLMGQVMRQLGGSGNPEIVRKKLSSCIRADTKI